MKKNLMMLMVICYWDVACTATQKHVALNEGLSIGIAALGGTTQKELELDGAKGVLKVINTP